MGAAGHRLERHPGQRARRGFDHCVIGDRVARAFIAMLRDAHEALFLALLFGEEGRDAPLPRLRHAGDQRPVDLACRARAKCFRQRRRRKARLGDQQAAGGVLVEPVHEARALPVDTRLAQHLQHAVEMARGAGAALHREAHRLVQHHHVGILVQRDGFEEIASSSRPRRTETRSASAHSSLSGGMRICWPVSRRSFGSARLPFTRTSPLRMMRWMWLNESPGNRCSKKRSSRMPPSSAETVTVWTPVAISGSGAGSGLASGSARRGGRSKERPGRGRGSRVRSRPLRVLDLRESNVSRFGRSDRSGISRRPGRASPRFGRESTPGRRTSWRVPCAPFDLRACALRGPPCRAPARPCRPFFMGTAAYRYVRHSRSPRDAGPSSRA